MIYVGGNNYESELVVCVLHNDGTRPKQPGYDKRNQQGNEIRQFIAAWCHIFNVFFYAMGLYSSINWKHALYKLFVTDVTMW